MTVKARWQQLWLQRARKLKAGIPYRKRFGDADSSDSDVDVAIHDDRQQQAIRPAKPATAWKGAADAQAQLLERKAQQAARFVRARRGEMGKLLAISEDKQRRGLDTGLEDSDAGYDDSDEDLPHHLTCRCKHCFFRLHPGASSCQTCGQPQTPKQQPSPRSSIRTEAYEGPHTVSTSRSAPASPAAMAGWQMRKDRGSQVVSDERGPSPSPVLGFSPRTPQRQHAEDEKAMRRMLRNLHLKQSLDAARGSASDSSSDDGQGPGWRGSMGTSGSARSARAGLGQTAGWPQGLSRPGSWQSPLGDADSVVNRRLRSKQVVRQLAPFMAAIKAHDKLQGSRPASSSQAGQCKRLPWWAE